MLNHLPIEEKKALEHKISHLTTVLMGAAITFVISVFLVKLLWDWTIPGLFPMAVEQGLIAGTITWLVAFKITALSAILTTTGSLVAGSWSR